MNVLIVEDQEATADPLRMILTARGHVVTEITHDFTSLIDDWPWHRYDVLVCDLVLSADTTGIEVLIAARLANPQIRRVVLSSAEPRQMESLTDFSDARLTKPTSVKELIAAIEETAS